MELIRRRGRNEHQTLIKKFLDPSKESLRRLKALKNALGTCAPCMTLYEQVLFIIIIQKGRNQKK